MSMPERVAVVVVHGIADQRAGQTVRELARLLCHGGAGEPRYVQGEMHEILVPVARLEPGVASPAVTPAPAGGGQKAETARQRPGTPSGFYQTQRSAPAPAPSDPTAPDLGLALNDYLLGRLELPEREALYESTRVSLRRRANDRPVDLYELYWADLSRLGEGGLRALSASYQLFFHLSTLAADVVDQVSLSVRGGTAWRLLQRLHAWLAWLMKGPAALVQLSMLLLIPFGAAALVSPDQAGQMLRRPLRGVRDRTGRGGLAFLAARSIPAGAVGEAPGPAGGRRRGRPGGLECPVGAGKDALRRRPAGGRGARHLADRALRARRPRRSRPRPRARRRDGDRALRRGRRRVAAGQLTVRVDADRGVRGGRVAAGRDAGDRGRVRRGADGGARARIVPGPRRRRRRPTVARYGAPGRRRLDGALRRAEPRAVVDVRVRRRPPAVGFSLPARDIQRHLSVGRNLPRRSRPDLRRVLHAADAGVHGSRLGHAPGAGALAAGGDLADGERRFARATARGDRVVGAARRLARRRTHVAEAAVRRGRVARRDRRRGSLPRASSTGNSPSRPASRASWRGGWRAGSTSCRARRWWPRESGSPAAP